MPDKMDWYNVSELSGHTHNSLFIQALREDSNQALDWLWLATQLDDEMERQYCLQRALYIDPTCVAVHSQSGLFSKFKHIVRSALKARTTANRQTDGQVTTNH